MKRFLSLMLVLAEEQTTASCDMNGDRLVPIQDVSALLGILSK